jgi:hypothetical protein
MCNPCRRRLPLPNAASHVLQLADALRGNSSITSVNLCSNHIGDDGIQASLQAACVHSIERRQRRAGSGQQAAPQRLDTASQPHGTYSSRRDA